MLRFKQVIVNVGILSHKLVELTEDNIDEVIDQLHKAGYLAGRSNCQDCGIYFSKTGGSGEPNQTCAGELLVVEGNTWARLRDKEFNLSDANIRAALGRGYRKRIMGD